MSENKQQSEQLSSSKMTEESIVTLALHDYVKQRTNIQEVFHLSEQSSLKNIEDKALKLKEQLTKLK